MNRQMRFLRILITISLITSFAGCSLLAKKPGAQQGATANAPGGQQQAAPPIAGPWEIAFQLGDKTYKCDMSLQQDGTNFQGQGADQDTGHQFNVLDGTINGDQVFFKKAYPEAGPDTPPVEYAGKIEMVNDKDYQGPYMSGDYTALVNGKQVSGPWEGQMSPGQGGQKQAAAPDNAPPGGQTSAQSSGPAPSTSSDSDKAPDLSGKWKVGFEYNFKTIKSVMFLEQDGGKITGHGTDENTKEKFTIDKGWYNYPRVTLVRKYTKGKGAAADRTMTFKAQVQNINDGDYHGPYMSGKTNGGGAWEAQMVSWH